MSHVIHAALGLLCMVAVAGGAQEPRGKAQEPRGNGQEPRGGSASTGTSKSAPAPSAAPQTPPGASETPTEPPPAPDEIVKQALAAFDRLEQGGNSTGDAAEINRLFKLLAETAKDNPWILYIRGRSAVLSGRTMDGLRDLQDFTKTPPGANDWKTFRILGDVTLKDFPRLAESHYRNALALADREPSIYLGLSQAVFKLGKHPEGLDLAKRAVDLDGGKSTIYFDNLAQLLRADGKADQAIAVVNRTIQMLQKQLDAGPNDGGTLRRLGAEYETALSLITDRLRTNPEDAAGYVALAAIAENLAELRRRLLLLDAIDVIEREGLGRMKDNAPADLRVAYASLLESAGRLDDARTQLQMVLAAEPSHAAAKERLDALNAAASGPGKSR